MKPSQSSSRTVTASDLDGPSKTTCGASVSPRSVLWVRCPTTAYRFTGVHLASPRGTARFYTLRGGISASSRMTNPLACRSSTGATVDNRGVPPQTRYPQRYLPNAPSDFCVECDEADSPAAHSRECDDKVLLRRLAEHPNQKLAAIRPACRDRA